MPIFEPKQTYTSQNTGADPINKTWAYIYATLILEHSYWLKFWSNQSEYLKTSVDYFYAENIFIGLGPGIMLCQVIIMQSLRQGKSVTPPPVVNVINALQSYSRYIPNKVRL